MQPTWDVRRLTPAQWAASLASNFSAWGPGVGAVVGAAYAFESAISPQLALSTIAGDFMTTCGMIGLAREALGAPGARRTAPTYALVGSTWPSAPGGYPSFSIGYNTSYAMREAGRRAQGRRGRGGQLRRAVGSPRRSLALPRTLLQTPATPDPTRRYCSLQTCGT